MDCPNCGARMAQVEGTDSWNCDYCRTVYYASKNEENLCLTGEASEFACPVCAVALEKATMDGHAVAFCRRCRGCLIRVEEFVLLLDDLRARQSGAWAITRRADPKELERQIACPGCGRRMDTHFYGGPGSVVIDNCARCELNWLDQGELSRIIRAPQVG